MQAAQRLRSFSRLVPRLSASSRISPAVVSATYRHLSTSSGGHAPDNKNKPPSGGILARLLASNDGAQNPILSALGFYSAESRAIGAGNELYKQALTRANAVVAAEARDKNGFAPRFEMLSVHVYLTLRRLRAEKGSSFEAEVKTAMQCLFDVFWTDVRTRMMMREHGLNLIQSGKWIKDCEQRFFGMALAFDEAWDNEQKMRVVIQRNVTCLETKTNRVEQFRRYMVRERARLDQSSVEQIWEGVCWDDKYPQAKSA